MKRGIKNVEEIGDMWIITENLGIYLFRIHYPTFIFLLVGLSFNLFNSLLYA